jgi:signal peptidase I
VSERWDPGLSAQAREGRATPAEAERPLRRHSQPRHAEDDQTGYRLPAGRRPDPSSFDPTLTALDVPLGEVRGYQAQGHDPLGHERPGYDQSSAGPSAPTSSPASGPMFGPMFGPASDPRSGPTSFPASSPQSFPGLGAPADDGAGPRIPAGQDRRFDAAIRPAPASRMQRGSRLRIGPRHGSGGRRSEDHRPKTPLGAALGAAGEIVVVLGMALLLSLLIKTFLVQAFFIPSTSMENTLLVGDRVLVSKLTPGVFELHRGDVVVFKDPGGWLTAEQSVPPEEQTGVGATVRHALSFVGLLPQDAGEHLIKRVIGVGGDHVQCCDAKGRVEVNDIPIDETSYLFPGAAASERPFNVKVPYGYLWVMGDNRPVSADSRLHLTLNNGMVPVHDVVGKAFVVVWPFERAGGLGIPTGVFGRVPQPASP